MKKPSIKDVAKKADVSIGTVDRVIHNRGQVSEATKSKILRVIEELNYVPNTIASSLASQKVYKIGVLLPEPIDENNYWYYPISGIRKAFKEHTDFQVELKPFYFEINSVSSFKEKAQLLLESKPDGVITAPVYEKELLTLIHQFEANNIRYAFIDSDLKHSNRSFYIGQNTFQSGRVAAQLLNYALPPKASKILILRIYSVFQGIPTLIQREEGFIQYLKDLNPDHIFHTKSIEYLPGDNLSHHIANILDSPDEYAAIFVPNSKIYLVAPFLESIGTNRPVLLGFDVLKKTRELMQKGLIDFLISQRPITQGYEAFQILLRFLIEKKNSSVIKNIPIDIITSENISKYDHLDT